MAAESERVLEPPSSATEQLATDDAAFDKASAKATRTPHIGSRAAKSFKSRPGLALSPLVIPLIAFLMIAVRTYLHVGNLLVPAPGDVAQAFWTDLTSTDFHYQFEVTLYEVLVGLVIGSLVGFVAGSLFAQFQFLEDLIYPYIVALQAMPKVAIAPLMVLWLGFGVSSKIVITALISFFPLMINVMVGLRSAESGRLELMNTLSASKWQIWRYLRLPTAMPMIAAGMQVATVLAMVGAIVGEFVGTSAGLGYTLLQRNTQVDTASVYSVLIYLALMGFFLTYAVRWVGHRAVFWEASTRNGPNAM